VLVLRVAARAEGQSLALAHLPSIKGRRDDHFT
jgi:hypothetical protein